MEREILFKREILFRGKAINRDSGYYRTTYKNGDWVYGLLTRPYNERYDLPAEMTNTLGVSGIEVDYETIGQYTGLTDKSGTKIFEGDIIESVSRLVNSVGTPTGGTDISRYIIEWGEHKWVKKIFFCNRGDYWKKNNVLPEDLYPYTASRYCEVIGNIYDNPELLKKE